MTILVEKLDDLLPCNVLGKSGVQLGKILAHFTIDDPRALAEIGNQPHN